MKLKRKPRYVVRHDPDFDFPAHQVIDTRRRQRVIGSFHYQRNAEELAFFMNRPMFT